MAATPAFDHAIPAPFDAQFTNGERMLGVSDPLNAAVTGTYHLSSWLNLEPGIYNLKIALTGAGSVRIGNGLTSMETVLTLNANAVAFTQVYIPPGQQRIDISFAHVAAGQNAGAAFLIFNPEKVIYASKADTWVFDSTYVADADLPDPADPRLSLPVFPFLPNWSSGVTERIAYLTDIRVSEAGVEEPRVVRQHPRRSFEVSFLRHGVNRARLDSFFVGVGRRPFLMPMWHEQYRPAGVTTGDIYCQFPGGTLALREFMVGGLVILTVGDPNDYELLEVGALDFDLDRLVWATPPTRAWPDGVRVMPLRRVAMTDQAQMSNPSDRVATTSIRFELQDNEHRFGQSWGYCVPLWRLPINRADALQVGYDRTTYTIDNEVGPTYTVDPGERAHVSQRFSVLLRGREQVVALRRFMDAAKGRAAPFYVPSFTHDIEPAGSMSGLVFDVTPFGFTQYLEGPQWARTWVAVVLSDGSPTIYRKISNVAPVNALVPPYGVEFERITLTEPLPQITRSQIERIQFVVPCRFDQDTFELQHLVDENAAVRTTLTTRSLDGDVLADIECVVTSELYPLDAIDSMETDMSVTGGSLRQMPHPDDEMELALVLESGTLGEPMVLYNDGDPEAFDVSMTVEGGTLVAPLVTYDEGDPEALDLSAEITAGTLRAALLTYSDGEPEALDLALTVESGTLT